MFTGARYLRELHTLITANLALMLASYTEAPKDMSKQPQFYRSSKRIYDVSIAWVAYKRTGLKKPINSSLLGALSYYLASDILPSARPNIQS